MKKYRLLKDKIVSKTFLTLTILSIFIVVLVGVGLYYKSIPILEKNSLSKLLLSSEWKPFKEAFGFYPFILGTLWITGIAILIALPC
jgi:phosphate transport system permease protein